MPRRIPPLNALFAFDAAARNNSFTRAAKELFIAQPAVTRHVAKLEGWLGVTLFTRHGSYISLTKEGHEVAELTTSVFDRLEIGLKGINRSRANEVLIGASFGIVHLWLMPRITDMRDAAPGVAINFITSDNYNEFDANKVELSIRFGCGDWSGYQTDLLFPEETYIIASPDFIKAHPELDPEHLADTLKVEWMLDHGDPFNIGWITWKQWFEHQGLVAPQLPQPQVRNYPTLLDMVKSGEGLTIGTVGIDDHYIDTGEIIRLGTPIKREGFGYYLTYHAEELENSAVQSMRHYLLNAAKSVAK